MNLEMGPAATVCQGCGVPLLARDSTLQLERHIAVLDSDGVRHDRRGGALVMLRLCLPCAWANLPRLEAALARELAAIREEMR